MAWPRLPDWYGSNPAHGERDTNAHIDQTRRGHLRKVRRALARKLCVTERRGRDVGLAKSGFGPATDKDPRAQNRLPQYSIRALMGESRTPVLKRRRNQVPRLSLHSPDSNSGTGSLSETETKDKEGFASLPFNLISSEEAPTDIAYAPGSASHARACTL